jgi:hypothetical protein
MEENKVALTDALVELLQEVEPYIFKTIIIDYINKEGLTSKEYQFLAKIVDRCPIYIGNYCITGRKTEDKKYMQGKKTTSNKILA